MVRRKSKFLDAAGARSLSGQGRIYFRSSKKPSFSGAGKFLYGLIILFFLGAIVYSIFFSNFLAVTKIEVGGAEKLDPAEIRKIVEKEISGNFLNFIPGNNILLASKDSIGMKIIEKYKYTEKVEIEKEFPNKLVVQVKERKFILTLCSAGNCAVVDSRGAVFTEADFEKSELGEKNMPVLFDEGNKSFILGDVVLEKEYFEYLLGISEKIKNELGINMESELRTPQIASGDIRAKTTEGWMVYFDKNIPLNKEVGMLKIVLENKIGPSQRSELEYIDLRAENKVYYKFRNGEKQAADQPASEEKKN